jgi:hypothetical protein
MTGNGNGVHFNFIPPWSIKSAVFSLKMELHITELMTDLRIGDGLYMCAMEIRFKPLPQALRHEILDFRLLD